MMMAKKTFRKIFCTFLSVLSLLTSAAYADYYSYDETGGNNPESYIVSGITVDSEQITLDPGTEGEIPTEWNITYDDICRVFEEALISREDEKRPLTPDGNLELVDDILVSEGYGETEEYKQFLTVKTRAGNYYYIIVDRAGDEENVHFLNMVDERDLFSLMDEKELLCTCTDKCEEGDTDLTCEACMVSKSLCKGVKKAESTEVTEQKDEKSGEEKEEKSGTPKLIFVFVILVAIAAAAVILYVKIIPKKKQKDENESESENEENEEE